MPYPRRHPNPSPLSLVAQYNDRSLWGYNEGDPVGKLTDLTGKHPPLTATGADRPTYKAAFLHGRPVLSFSANSLSGAPVITSSQPRTLYLVVNPSFITAASILDLNADPAGANGSFFSVDATIGVKEKGQNRVFTPAMTSGAWQILTVRLAAGADASLATARLNSVNLAQASAAPGTPNTGSGGLMLGNGFNGRFPGYLAEVRIYQANHADFEAAHVEAALKAYWGL